MRCPECQAEQLAARYCVRCGARMQPPSAEKDSLDVVPESPGIPADAGSSGTFAYGRDTPVARTLVRSDWADPLRMTVLGWLVFSALFDIYFVVGAQYANVPLLAAWLLGKAFLAVGAYAGKTAWVFFACMGVAGLYAGFGLVALGITVVDVAHRHNPRGALVVVLVGATGVALAWWMGLALRRHGPWAARWVLPG